MSMHLVCLDEYEEKMIPYREKYLDSELMAELASPEIDSELLHLFWIYFSVLGVHMTDAVERWIAEAGKASIRLGYTEIGEKLIKHASHEVGHHRMMERDSMALIELWNKISPRKITLQDFAGDMPQVIQDYIKLHEDNIKSDTPWSQIAIEYEIERVSTVLGPQMLANTKAVCGGDVLDRLSFTRDHAEIDAAHTVFNRQVLMEFLESNPEALMRLVDTGAESLRIYSGFLVMCYNKAKHHFDH